MIKITTYLRAFAVAMLVGVGCVAANAATLYLHTSTSADKAVELGEISQIVFGDAAVTIKLTDGSNVQVALSDFTSLSTSKSKTSGESAINDIVVSDGRQWTVFDIKGNRVANAADVVKDGKISLSSQLAPGVYILKSESKTIKVVVP